MTRFTEGNCQTWVHRGCGSLSKNAFRLAKAVSSWKCSTCRLATLSQEVTALKEAFTVLSQKLLSEFSCLDSKVIALTEELSSLSSNPVSAVLPIDSPPLIPSPVPSLMPCSSVNANSNHNPGPEQSTFI